MKRLFLVVLAALMFSMMASANENRININVNKFSTVPTIDGIVSEGEWGSPVASITPSSEYYLKYLEEANGQNTDSVIPSKIELYLGWTLSNLYVALEVTDSTHYNPFEGADCWMGDSFEFDIGVNLNNQNVRFRNNIALGNNNTVYAIIFNRPSEDLSSMVPTSNDVPVPGNYRVTRSGNVTTYELELPWSTFSPTGTVSAGYKFYFNTQVHVSDGVMKGTGDGYEDYLGMVRYGTEDSNGKTLFALLTLVDDETQDTESDSDSDTESDTEEDTSEPVNSESDSPATPDTGDDFWFPAASLLALMSFAAIAAYRKEKNQS